MTDLEYKALRQAEKEGVLPQYIAFTEAVTKIVDDAFSETIAKLAVDSSSDKLDDSWEQDQWQSEWQQGVSEANTLGL